MSSLTQCSNQFGTYGGSQNSVEARMALIAIQIMKYVVIQHHTCAREIVSVFSRLLLWPKRYTASRSFPGKRSSHST